MPRVSDIDKYSAELDEAEADITFLSFDFWSTKTSCYLT